MFFVPPSLFLAARQLLVRPSEFFLKDVDLDGRDDESPRDWVRGVTVHFVSVGEHPIYPPLFARSSRF